MPMGRKQLALDMKTCTAPLACRTDRVAGEGKKAIYELTGEENTLPNLTGKMGGKAAKKYSKVPVS